LVVSGKDFKPKEIKVMRNSRVSMCYIDHNALGIDQRGNFSTLYGTGEVFEIELDLKSASKGALISDEKYQGILGIKFAENYDIPIFNPDRIITWSIA
jgi:hypothetical protein